MESLNTSLQLPRSAVRVLALLDHVVTVGRSTLTEAAEAVDLPVSTALRHLLTLQQAGFLDRDPDGIFCAGPGFLRLALQVTSAGPHARLAELARMHLLNLTHCTEESTYLAVRDGSRAVYTACVEGTRAVRHVGWVGHTVPIADSAVGEALTAIERNRPPTVRTGAVEPDITAISVPIFGAGPSPVGAISVIGPTGRLVGERLEAAVEAANSVRHSFELDLMVGSNDRDPSLDTQEAS